jgi:hypothetical protein
MVEIWYIIRRLGSIKGDFCVGTVTEGLVFRLPAAAQGILFLQGICYNLMPGAAVSLFIVADLFYLDGDAS